MTPMPEPSTRDPRGIECDGGPYCQSFHHTDSCLSMTQLRASSAGSLVASRINAAYIERDGRFWTVVYPAASDNPADGLDLCTGPHLTRWGAQASLWLRKWLERC